jgi:hypothetical protein
MLRRLLPLVCFIVLVIAAGVPSQAWAHGGHSHAAQTEIAAVTPSAFTGEQERHEVAASLHDHAAPGEQPANDCHCPACHGCCHAPALNDAPSQLAPFSLLSHAAPREGGALTRRWRSPIENPPKTFA